MLKQIDFKRRLEEIERKRSCLEDEEMMKKSQEKDEKLQQELQLRTSRGFKKLDLSQVVTRRTRAQMHSRIHRLIESGFMSCNYKWSIKS